MSPFDVFASADTAQCVAGTRGLIHPEVGTLRTRPLIMGAALRALRRIGRRVTAGVGANSNRQAGYGALRTGDD